MTITCARCGTVVGSVKDYLYGGPYGDDRIDYGDPEYNEDYGGDIDGASYCDNCVGAVEEAGDDEEENEEED
jgi:hypothetical protein